MKGKDYDESMTCFLQRILKIIQFLTLKGSAFLRISSMVSLKGRPFFLNAYILQRLYILLTVGSYYLHLEKLKNCKINIWHRPIPLVDPQILCVSLWAERIVTRLSPSPTDLFPKEMNIFRGLSRGQSQWVDTTFFMPWRSDLKI